ncbi:PrgH/EprH family type III secretion apparatus protein [Providencia alcalifaciens]|uniref:PrgH/EprH family type III secretion apparatus protein n=2 Tax=Providencia alcalifaciens TaxID=126385 RepID=UPI001CC78704|nr:PrgH/EprH family type III secretion apparatus protein [Providencia alcalifaciens]CAG9406732.1 Protein PrgH [Providencia alcalifaciens]CAG9406744.1 Protein PrgH [Providencia alcalifaciens]CAG9406912.1 Protein PrgH [Providencia alcalifaciens]CAG9407889.1 Protein PrgH [Providencia alcalifaciens]CAG9407989.1 Protein PrgH [Providencia alcalifaciens]
MIEPKLHTCIIKIISGPMSGQELMINIDKNIIITDRNISYKTEIDENGFTTYYIPSEKEKCEFSILSNQESNNGLTIHLTQENSTQVFPITFQDILLIDRFPFIIKKLNDEWKTHHAVRDPNEIPVIHPENHSDYIKRYKVTFNKKWLILILLFLTIILSITFAFQINPKNDAEKRIQSIDNILKGSQHPIIYTQGKNGKTLILVRTQRDADWSQQILLKKNHPENYTILKIKKLEEEIEEKLIDTVPNLLKVDIENPCQPIIRVIKSPLPNSNEKNINQLLSTYFHCYKQSKIVETPFNELIKKSELGLAESNVKWQKITKDNKVIFVIRDSLNDKQTLSLISFTNSFSQKWGTKQIQFSVSLANNELAGKSFITHTNGITLLGNNHWLFNSNQPN